MCLHLPHNSQDRMDTGVDVSTPAIDAALQKFRHRALVSDTSITTSDHDVTPAVTNRQSQSPPSRNIASQIPSRVCKEILVVNCTCVSFVVDLRWLKILIACLVDAGCKYVQWSFKSYMYMYMYVHFHVTTFENFRHQRLHPIPSMNLGCKN